MANTIDSTTLPTPLSKKRTFDQFSTDLSSNASPSTTGSSQKDQGSIPTPTSDSVASSTSRQSSPVHSAAGSEPLRPPGSGTKNNSPANLNHKKRKLTVSEKLQRLQEKEALDREKAEQKARKEIEKQVKAEERRKRDEEKEAAKRQKEFERAEKQKVKDEKTQVKEEKKRQEEEAKAKKEKAQPKLSAFFKKPAATTTPSESPTGSRRSSAAGLENVSAPPTPGPEPTTEAPRKADGTTDYERTFLPFYVSSTTALAPFGYQTDERHVQHKLSIIDKAMSTSAVAKDFEGPGQLVKPFDPVKIFELPFKRKRQLQYPGPIREVVSANNGSSTSPVDLTVENGQNPLSDVLRRTKCKYLQFREDVRPPYIGTYTKFISPRSARILSVRPFTRALPSTDYDYDSEAEWEPPQEGDEDIGSDDEDADASDDDDDMEGFLDDENDSLQRQMVLNDMQPISSGLRWDNSTGNSPFDLSALRIQPITPFDGPNDLALPIDPHSAAYWPQPPEPAGRSASASSLMQPPSRPPLQSLHPNSAISLVNSALSKSSGSTTAELSGSFKKSSPPNLKLVPADVLPRFKQAIEGKTCTKVGLVEMLKQEFPKITKNQIAATIPMVASREGLRDAEKKWVLK